MQPYFFGHKKKSATDITSMADYLTSINSLTPLTSEL